jgi:hypothetical protein
VRDPERYVVYIDSAIQIHDTLEAERQKQLDYLNSKARQIERARQIMGMTQLSMPPPQPEEQKTLQPEQPKSVINKKFKAITGE